MFESGETEKSHSLDRLINICDNSNHELLKYVKRPELLKRYLLELRDNIIGMESLKESIASQTMHLIVMSEKNRGIKSNHMLNTVIYGPAGVGKTTIGTLLTKIWYALGYLERGTGAITKTNDSLSDPFSKLQINSQIPGNLVNMYYFALTVVIFIPLFKQLYNVLGKYGLIISGIIVVFIIYYIAKTSVQSSEQEIIEDIKNIEDKPKKNNSTSRINLDDDLFIDGNPKTTLNDSDHYKMISKENKIHPKNQDPGNDIIRIVSRGDFVAGYLGQTAIKTKELLMKNKGKVLFIDEAYSLYNGINDAFGMEALTTLNLYMSEHPNDVVIIFAGYKDLMQKGIFEKQPGLVRRCMWHFECPGYRPMELFSIFKLQLEKEGWKISNENVIKRLFERHHHLFPNFGGDCEKLGFFSQLEYTKESFNGGIQGNRMLTPTHIRKGLIKLKENNIKKDSDKQIKSEELSMFNDFLREYQNQNRVENR